MGNARTVTLQQKLGFLDDDLKTPEHDAMIMWIDANVTSILKEALNPDISWDMKRRQRLEEIAQQAVLADLERCKKTLGCDYLTDNGHIDIDAGIFGILTDEKLKPVLKGIALSSLNRVEDRKPGFLYRLRVE